MIAVALACHLAVTIPVWIHPVGVAFEDSLQKSKMFKNTKPVVTRIIVRSLIVLSLGGVAILSPQVTPLQGVSGAFTTTIICIILPAILYIFLKFKLAKISKEKISKDKMELQDDERMQQKENGMVVTGDSALSPTHHTPRGFAWSGDNIMSFEGVDGNITAHDNDTYDDTHVYGDILNTNESDQNNNEESNQEQGKSESSTSVEMLADDAIVEAPGPLKSDPCGQISIGGWALAGSLVVIGIITIVIGCIYSMRDLIDSWRNQSF